MSSVIGKLVVFPLGEGLWVLPTLRLNPRVFVIQIVGLGPWSLGKVGELPI